MKNRHLFLVTYHTLPQSSSKGLMRVDNIVLQLFNQGISAATRAVYQSAWRKYSLFCRQYTLPLLPLTEHTLCQFAAVLSQTVSWGTIQSYLSGLRFHQISAGLPDPAFTSLPRLSYILKGIRKVTPAHTRGKRLPITPDLRRMCVCECVSVCVCV